MILEKIGIFLLFLGPLVFFHELGHYFFARLFGVRVETFSLGFGPKIFKYTKNKTEYVISLIPLGGYLKMFGDDPFNRESIPLDERACSFVFKNKWERFWIVMGGPLANFVLAFVIFWGLLMSGEKVPEIRMGPLTQKNTFYQLGFRSGDTLKKINGKEIFNPSDIALIEGERIKKISIERFGVAREIKIDIRGEDFFKTFVENPLSLRMPLLINRQGQVIAVSTEPESVNWKRSLDEIVYVEINKNKKIYFFKTQKDKDNRFIEQGLPFFHLTLEAFKKSAFGKKFENREYRALDLQVRSVNRGSPAEKSGLKDRDVIISFNNKAIASFDELRLLLQKTKKEKIVLHYWRAGKVFETQIRPDIKRGQWKKIKLIGVYSAAEFIRPQLIDVQPLGFLKSGTEALYRTWGTGVKMLVSFKKIITSEISFKNIGGPFSIGKVAADSFNTSTSYFLQLMALFSINLGIVNLFPIPVLDGGHIMFIFLEILNKGPISNKKMEIAQRLGLSLLLILMIGAIFNDISRLF